MGVIKATAELSLKGRALRLLSGREYSRPELERKLAPHETAPGELAQALDALQAKGFISEARVIESVIHRRAAKLGAARIRQELQGKGLGREAVRAAVADLQITELARAREVWRRKFGATAASGLSPADARSERHRQARFLAARGFGGDVIRQVVAGVDDLNDRDDADGVNEFAGEMGR
jgi:regulatory protein